MVMKSKELLELVAMLLIEKKSYDFESFTEENYKTINGYITIDVELLRRAGDPEDYDILKNTRAELMQNEKEFVWYAKGGGGSGLTILPTIDGEYYKQYSTHTYISPIILFPHRLSSAGRLRVDYYYTDGSNKDLHMYVRSYDMDEGKWSEWVSFTNDTVPNTTPALSCA